MFQNKQKNRFFNPIWQNNGHINALKNVVDIDHSDLYKSYIIFSERCELKKITVASPNIKVIKRNKLIRVIKADIATSEKHFTIAEVDELFVKLERYACVDESVKKAHINQIEKKLSPPRKEIPTDTSYPKLLEIIIEELAKVGIDKDKAYKCTERRNGEYICEIFSPTRRRKNIVTVWANSQGGGSIRIVGIGKYKDQRTFDETDIGTAMLQEDLLADLDKHGFGAKFTHAVSKQDFTTAIQYSSDPEDEETYIPWVITGLELYNPTEKYASFYINTEENMEAEAGNQSNEEKLTAKLSPSVAWGALSIYGKQQYPYGFKVK